HASQPGLRVFLHLDRGAVPGADRQRQLIEPIGDVDEIGLIGPAIRPDAVNDAGSDQDGTSTGDDEDALHWLLPWCVFRVAYCARPQAVAPARPFPWARADTLWQMSRRACR